MSCMARRCEGSIRLPNFLRYALPCSRKISATSSISNSQVAHELVDGGGAKLFGSGGQMRVDAGGGGRAMAQLWRSVCTEACLLRRLSLSAAWKASWTECLDIGSVASASLM